MKEAEESWLSCQWILVAYVELLRECFSLEDFNQAICLSDVSINILGAVSTVSLGVKRINGTDHGDSLANHGKLN